MDSGVRKEMEILLLRKAAMWVGEDKSSGLSNQKEEKEEEKQVHEMSGLM